MRLNDREPVRFDEELLAELLKVRSEIRNEVTEKELCAIIEAYARIRAAKIGQMSGSVELGSHGVP